MPFNRHRDMNFISYSITNIPLYIKIIPYLCTSKTNEKKCMKEKELKI